MNDNMKLLIIVMFTLLFSCTEDLSKDNIPKESELKRKIIEGLNIEHSKYDTIVYQYGIAFCGNSTEEEINSTYNPLLNESPFDSILSSELGSVILIKDIGTYYDRRYPILRISAQLIKNEVHTTERLNLGELEQSNTSLYSYENGLWVLKNKKLNHSNF